MSLRTVTLLTCAALCLAPATRAQDAQAEAEAPAGSRIGTTVIGERESPIGLYITPWRRSAPEPTLDRPARLLVVEPEPVDHEVYRRQVEYHDKLAEARAENRRAGRNP